MGGIPKECSSDNDCISDTGNEVSKCMCGLNTDGLAYCALHYSDEPMVSWREAERDREYKLEIYWKFVSVNYPYLQGKIDSCMGDVWRDYNEYQKGKPKTASSFAELGIIFVGGYFLMQFMGLQGMKSEVGRDLDCLEIFGLV